MEVYFFNREEMGGSDCDFIESYINNDCLFLTFYPLKSRWWCWKPKYREHSGCLGVDVSFNWLGVRVYYQRSTREVL